MADVAVQRDVMDTADDHAKAIGENDPVGVICDGFGQTRISSR